MEGTVNEEIFAQYIFWRILRRVLYAQKYNVSEKINRDRSNRINCYMCENLPMRKWHIGLGAGRFSCTKISRFTVFVVLNSLKYACDTSW